MTKGNGSWEAREADCQARRALKHYSSTMSSRKEVLSARINQPYTKNDLIESVCSITIALRAIDMRLEYTIIVPDA